MQITKYQNPTYTHIDGSMIRIFGILMVVCLPLFIVLLIIKRKKFGAEEISESSDMV